MLPVLLGLKEHLTLLSQGINFNFKLTVLSDSSFIPFNSHGSVIFIDKRS